MKIPAPTYPLRLDTIGALLSLGDELVAHCHNPGCNRHRRVNLVALARKHGFGQSCMAADLRPLFFCSSCRAAGRPDRNIGFTHKAADRHSVVAERQIPSTSV